MEKSDCCVVGVDLVAVAAGNCYLAVLDSSVISENCSGISKCLAEVRVLRYWDDMAIVAGRQEREDVAGNCCRIVEVVVGLVAWALLSSFHASSVGGEDTGCAHKDLALVDSGVEELAADTEVDRYYSVGDGYQLSQMDCEKSAAVADSPVS